jgi:hypothetical protein
MRTLREIAQEIHSECHGKSWYPYAEAYVGPMMSLGDIRENYYEDSGESIVRYALANLTYWRGDTARRVKAELNSMLRVVSQV